MTIGAARRISVVGTTGSGKTTIARWIARQLQASHVELDALYWGAEWTPAPRQVFRARVLDALRPDAWVADGNYSQVRDVVWSRAQMVVWLDYSLPVILWRLLRRTVHRSIRQVELWNGNRESLSGALLSRESIILWALRTYWRRRREYPSLFRKPVYAHLTIVHLRSPHSACAWMTTLEKQG